MAHVNTASTSTGLIIDPSTGGAAQLATREITAEQARIFREYKKVMQTLGLKEALYCDQCWNANLSNGCEAFVTSDRIVIRCRCTIRHGGASF